MSDQRRRCLDSMEKTTGCNIVLVTKAMVDDFLCPVHPLHPAYPQLSQTHMADYLRAYFMYHFGGGYADIKMQSGSWVESFEAMEAHPEMIGIGYREVPGGVPSYLRTQSGSPLGECWRMMIGNCAYIFRHDTDFLSLWFDRLHRVLDDKSSALQLHPARIPRDRTGVTHDGTASEYPLVWSEILADIFSPLSYQFSENLMNTLPPPVFRDYL